MKYPKVRQISELRFRSSDGGRSRYKRFRNKYVKDCAVRAYAIACQLPYLQAYNELRERILEYYRPTESVAMLKANLDVPAEAVESLEVHVERALQRRAAIGQRGVPYPILCAALAQHGFYPLQAQGIPPLGRYVVNVEIGQNAMHCAAVVNGVLHDTFDWRRMGWVLHSVHGRDEGVQLGNER